MSQSPGVGALTLNGKVVLGLVSDLTPFAYGPRSVRTLMIDGDPWFVTRDVCEVLDIRNASDALSTLDDDEKGIGTADTPGGHQRVSIVSESGLYVLILRSRKAEARKFRRWITHDVIPALRKTGSFGVSMFDPSNLDHVAQLAATAADQARQIEAARPAVEFVDQFVSGDGTYLLREVAAVLGVRGMGQNNLFAFLRDQGVLIRDGDSRNLPYRQHIEAGRFEVKAGKRDNSRTGEPVATRTVRVTPKGLIYIRNRLEASGYRCMGTSGDGQTTLTRATG